MTAPFFEVEIRRVGGDRTTSRLYNVTDIEPGVRVTAELRKGRPVKEKKTRAATLRPLDFDEALREVAELAGVMQDDQ